MGDAGPLRLEEGRMHGLPGPRRLGPVGAEILDDDLAEILDAALGEQRPLGAELVAAAAALGKTCVGGAEGCPQAHDLAQGGVFLTVRRQGMSRVAGRHLVLDEGDRLAGRLQHFELLLGAQRAGQEALEHAHEGGVALGGIERVQIAQELAVLLHAAQVGVGLSAVRHRWILRVQPARCSAMALRIASASRASSTSGAGEPPSLRCTWPQIGWGK